MVFRIQIIATLLFLPFLAWPLAASGVGEAMHGPGVVDSLSRERIGQLPVEKAEQLQFELDLEDALLDEAAAAETPDPSLSTSSPPPDSIPPATAHGKELRESGGDLEGVLLRMEEKNRRYGEELDRMEQMAAELTRLHVPEWENSVRNAQIQYAPAGGKGELFGATVVLRAFLPEGGKGPLPASGVLHGFVSLSREVASLIPERRDNGWGVSDYFSIRNGYIPPDSRIPSLPPVIGSSWIPAFFPLFSRSLLLSLFFFVSSFYSCFSRENEPFPEDGLHPWIQPRRFRRDEGSFPVPGFACFVFASIRSHFAPRRIPAAHFFPLPGVIS